MYNPVRICIPRLKDIKLWVKFLRQGNVKGRIVFDKSEEDLQDTHDYEEEWRSKNGYL